MHIHIIIIAAYCVIITIYALYKLEDFILYINLNYSTVPKSSGAYNSPEDLSSLHPRTIW